MLVTSAFLGDGSFWLWIYTVCQQFKLFRKNINPVNQDLTKYPNMGKKPGVYARGMGDIPQLDWGGLKVKINHGR